MGINGLLPFLKKASFPVNIKHFAGYTVAVDTYCWLHRSAYACAMDLALGNPTDQYVRYTLKYLEMLLTSNIKPILVFDGANLPSKAETEQKRKENKEAYRKKAAEFLLRGNRAAAQECFQRSVFVTPKMAHDVLMAARTLGVDCIVAPYEADAQLAYLNRTGYADLVITEDSDLLLYGCRQVIFKLDLTGTGVLVALTGGIGELCCGMRPNQFTDSTLRYMGILSGCDYFSGIPGIGLVTAAKILRQTRITNLRELLTKLGLYTNLNSAALSATMQPQGDHETESIPTGQITTGARGGKTRRDATKRLHLSLIDAAVRADRTFRLQVVFDPLSRRQLRLSEPTSEDIADEMRLSNDGVSGQADKENLFAFAGRLDADKTQALQVALGNIDFKSGALLGNFDPDRKLTASPREIHKTRSDSHLECHNHFSKTFPNSATSVRPVLGQIGGLKSTCSIVASSQPNKRRLHTSIWDKDFPCQKVWIHRRSNDCDEDASIYCLTVSSSSSPTKEPSFSVVRNAATIATEMSEDPDESNVISNWPIASVDTHGKQLFLPGGLRETLQQRFGKRRCDTVETFDRESKFFKRQMYNSISTYDNTDENSETDIVQTYQSTRSDLITPTTKLVDRTLLSSAVHTSSKYFPSKATIQSSPSVGSVALVDTMDDVSCALQSALYSEVVTTISKTVGTTLSSPRSPIFTRNPFRAPLPEETNKEPIASPMISTAVPCASMTDVWSEPNPKSTDSAASPTYVDAPSSPSILADCDPFPSQMCTPPSASHFSEDDDLTDLSPNFLSSHLSQPVANLISAASKPSPLSRRHTPCSVSSLQTCSSVERFVHRSHSLGSAGRTACSSTVTTTPSCSRTSNVRRSAMAPAHPQPCGDLRSYFSRWNFQKSDR